MIINQTPKSKLKKEKKKKTITNYLDHDQEKMYKKSELPENGTISTSIFFSPNVFAMQPHFFHYTCIIPANMHQFILLMSVRGGLAVMEGGGSAASALFAAPINPVNLCTMVCVQACTRGTIIPMDAPDTPTTTTSLHPPRLLLLLLRSARST